MAASKTFPLPHLLYVYPWMPFPRRVIIYLREKGLQNAVEIVPIDFSTKTALLDKHQNYPPKPAGSLPILVLPARDETAPVKIGQSMAILHYLEDMCAAGKLDHADENPGGMRGAEDPVGRARVVEMTTLAEELSATWNPVRMFGTAAGTMELPGAAREMLRWVKRALTAVETMLREDREGQAAHQCSALMATGGAAVNLADVVLFQFLEFVDDCYGLDITVGSGEVVTDVYGRQVEDSFPMLVEFYAEFKKRDSAKRDEAAGEKPPAQVLAIMTKWADGVL
ncbi:hypothetical protein MCOR27_011536 [Pyricularia oryzae]|uniref:GST N-terminal domain-containing protein n=2 Tax=Pyricularia TaxID=48558 RepID=A0ABQ8N225_PYRGI|nr:hypothetical protein MCOR01_009831 [Pyricularia oryzae]KAI6289927.1 hypothetical protein MCOR33_011638 [Pyricularia grisea]KAI6256197.1 hypothetical protein MCOR19_007315 [Pyricularia oryzae]KAI6265075.1 hypothetical protein MCOR27_011536 [Pyricularia oryzae]KAI6276712.1 hypothetical protein MCOR26_005503 [Pyricularia oryzae]